MSEYQWIPHKPETWPIRYGELQQDTKFSKYLGLWKDGEPAMKESIAKAGTTVKIVMASRFGDVGITDDLEATHGYKARVLLEQLDNLRGAP